MVTKAKRAASLYALLQRGPDFSATFVDVEGVSFTAEQKKAIEKHFAYGYRVWFRSWVLQEALQLLPPFKAEP